MNKHKKKYNKIISVIIPSYNIEKYIDKCLNSFVNDKILDYLDILVINDGSTDNTSIIAKKYETKYPKSIRVIDKTNGGHGSTINVGIQYAIGKYTMVVDGDDWINNNELLEIVESLNSMEDFDAIYYNYVTEAQLDNKKIYHSLNGIFSIPGNVNLDNSKLSIYNQIGLANTMYKTSILKEKKSEILEKTYYVDVEYMLFPLEYIKKAYYFDKTVYHYLVGRANQSINIKTALKHIDDRKKVVYDVVDKIHINDSQYLTSFHKKFYNIKLSSVINDYYDIVIRGNYNVKKNIKEMDNYIKAHDLLLYEYFTKQYKYIKVIRFFNYSLFVSKIAYKMDRVIKTIKKKINRSGING